MSLELEREERILADLKKLIYPESEPVSEYKVKDGNQKDGYCCDTSGWSEYRPKEAWSGQNQHRWFRTRVTIPERFDGRYVEMSVKTGKEGQWDATNPQMLFYLNEKIMQGIDVNHTHVLIAERAAAGDTFDIAFLAYSGNLSCDLLIQTELCVKDTAVEQFYYDLSVPVSAARTLQSYDPDNCRKILKTTAKAVDLLNLCELGSARFYHSIQEAEEILHREFYTDVDQEAPIVSAVGHTHIDIAWLWTVGQTREKVVRSFSTVLQLMKKYPDYKFMSSQPILYQFVKEQEPAMFEEIRQRVRERRWEVDGAMWLEPDCNIPSGESLVRQIMKGRDFFSREFGVESKSLWLPDSFGFNAALPQILRKSGIRYFMTTKIDWNENNRLPNDTFLWRGIDGSDVFVFMPTTCDFDSSRGENLTFSDRKKKTTYTGIINPNMTLGTYERFQNKDLTEDTLMLYGYGDGGGGPTAEMLENSKRLKYGLPGLPRIRLEFESDFFDRTYQKIGKDPEMPTWNGELYFEYHRGTYTSAAGNKRNNRKSEILYEQLETLSSMNRLSGGAYPLKQIQDGWDVILLNQFHDIIPGSCIGDVYQTTNREYAEILSSGDSLMAEQMKGLAGLVSMPKAAILAFNSLGYERSDILKGSAPFPVREVRDDEGNRYEVQYLDGDEFLFFAKGIPSVGYKVFTLIPGDKPSNASAEQELSFANQWYRVTFDTDGTILSLVEKETGQELIRRGQRGNELAIYEDRPRNWDNWNIDPFYKRKRYSFDGGSELKVTESGPARFCMEQKKTFLNSSLIQKIYLYRDIPRIDFKTTVDWQQNNLLLRVNFPVDINTTKATYEIQYGNLERETTKNHSWDSAKYEVCGHKWADVSEYSLGVSLLNDCKYGYGIKDGNLSLTLLKAGSYPNSDADIGIHHFTYSVYPHSGNWKDAATVQMAYNLNVPLQTLFCAGNSGTEPREYSMVSVSSGSCFIEMVKQAEDQNGMILRLYENKNSRGRVSVRLGFQPKSVRECDLMENTLGETEHNGNEFYFHLNPYEIKTFRIID